LKQIEKKMMHLRLGPQAWYLPKVQLAGSHSNQLNSPSTKMMAKTDTFNVMHFGDQHAQKRTFSIA
jgi:hypothetical protein